MAEFEKQKAEAEMMDERMMEIEEIESSNTRYDLESMRLDQQEIESIYGEQ